MLKVKVKVKARAPKMLIKKATIYSLYPYLLLPFDLKSGQQENVLKILGYLGWVKLHPFLLIHKVANSGKMITLRCDLLGSLTYLPPTVQVC